MSEHTSPSTMDGKLGIWPPAAQAALAILILLATVLVYIHSNNQRQSHPATREDEAFLTRRIDLNKASRAHLLLLPGIGPAMADRIETYRRDQGFQSIEDLQNVPGIGVAKMEQIRPWVYVDEPTILVRAQSASFQDKPPEAIPKTPLKTKKSPPPSAIDINTATAESLQKLPGIGPVLSRRIIEHRERTPFRKVDELRQVRGIGPKTLEKLRPHVIIGREE